MWCKRIIAVMITGCLVISAAVCADDGSQTKEMERTVLGIESSRFTINDKPVFLLGFSFYGGLGASKEFILQDLDDFQKRGFNWFRLWARWPAGTP